MIGAMSVASWWLAIPIARRWTGWVDIDHDGMLDGFVAGRYDSVDMYGGHWGALVTGVAAAGALALVALRWTRTRIDEVTPDLDAGHF